MRSISRRDLLGAGAGAAAAVGLAACGAEKGHGHKASAEATGKGAVGKGNAAGPPQRPMKLIGDGSTAYTGKQPNQPAAPVRLEPGQTPPQFVIFSWDGAGEVGTGLFNRFLDLAKQHDAGMTFFLSGLYLLPESKKDLYHPPNNPVGASAIGYLSDEHIKETLACVRRAWNEGHEIGTHYNGHFCSGSGSVGNWTSDDWRSEIDQAVDFVTKWRTNCGTPDADPLPFDYRKELVGSRTPCLLGQKQLLPTAAALGWRYDASSPGGLQTWPTKKMGVWDFPLQGIPFPGHTFEVLSMDYNILANQSKNTTHGMTSKYAGWRQQATESYMAGFKRAYETNRAPFFIGNHMETWNGGIYMDAVEDALKQIAGGGHKDVRLVSFRQFADWLDVQDPAILGKLQSLNVGEQPVGGWNTYLKAA
ncbi:twin-arginine translocation signal domain-containing protein [Streptomyces montanisoli]|uniref:Twin-arginine translocation signal domain-containing protein n=1 Tax=Streptomyces montanisoli TaxID=2798581 RepID=A0A940MAX1_9ACTN|nr:twin-arginine translocation signal domain-containing protein [Streptomyces montanisoli]MBP0456680.1 twin-arginine translocation signal domain-containing protein [Streptomyces montanisoli]